jgi:hypothetical protein
MAAKDEKIEDLGLDSNYQYGVIAAGNAKDLNGVN